MTFRPVDWFYVQNGSRIGPVPLAHFDDLVRSGRITRQTLVWREGLANWQPFGSITAAPSSLPSPPAPPPLPGVPQLVESGARIGCAECGVAFPESEMIPFAGSWICAKCKPIFIQRLREGAPLAAGGAEAWQSGDAVVTLHGGTLPARCVRCNGAVTGKPIERKFYWHPEWVYILLLIPLIYLIVYLIVAKGSRVSVPICDECRQRRRMFIAMSWSFVALGMVGLIAAPYFESVVLGIMAVVTELAAIILGLQKGMLVYTKKVDAQYVWVRGFCKEYRASLPEFPDPR
ncbi:MAG TPA: DUF4339 domain-containing protein [Verrucomicrobiae bacterium]|nr:DUF4339 domain-containing protein [Verrucomicrobiae bacterium]